MMSSRGPESKGRPASALEMARSYPSVRDLDLPPDNIPAEIIATRGQASHVPPVTRDEREPLVGHEIGAGPRQILDTACGQGVVHGLTTALASAISTLVCAAIPPSAFIVLGPASGACLLGAGCYTCYNVYHGARGAQPRSQGWRMAIGCATGLACAGAGAGAAVIGASPAFVHGGQAAANAIQGAMRVSRSWIRDWCNATGGGAWDSLRFVDNKGVNRGLSDPRMARMEAMRLLCTTLCYAGLQAAAVLVAQPMLADAMGADSLSGVIDDDGGFLDRWLATAPGAIVGSTVEGLDGFFGVTLAAASALVTGNHVIVEKGRGFAAARENLSAENRGATFVRAVQNALMRIGMGNPVADSQALASVWADRTVVNAFIAFVTEDQAIVPSAITELRGKLLAVGQAAIAALAAPVRERMRDAGEQTVWVQELQTNVTRIVDSPVAADRKAQIRPTLRGELGRIEAAFVPGATFNFHGVVCTVTGVNLKKGEVTISSRRAIGWAVDQEGGDGRFHYKKKSAQMAEALHENGKGVHSHQIDRYDPYQVFYKGMQKAAGVRDDKGRTIDIQRHAGGRWVAGDVEGDAGDVIAALFERGCRARHLALADGARDVAVGRRPVLSREHMESLLWGEGRQFELMRLAPEASEGPAAAGIHCIVGKSGFEADAALPQLPPSPYRVGENNGKLTYVGDREKGAKWLIEEFSVTETITRPLDPLLASAMPTMREARHEHIRQLNANLSKAKILKLEGGDGGTEELVVTVTRGLAGEKISLRGAPGSPDNSRDLAIWLVARWDRKNPSAVREVDREAEGVLVIRPRRDGVADASARPTTFEWPSAALPHDAIAAVPQPAAHLAPRVLSEEIIANARSSIQKLQEDFGTRPVRFRDGKRPVAGGNDDARQHNQRVLDAYMRVLDGASFLSGAVLPIAGIGSLLDHTGFTPEAVADAAADFEQVRLALEGGAGQEGMRLAGMPTPEERQARERARDQARSADLAAHLPAGPGHIVASYARDSITMDRDMVDAASLLAAGSPAGSAARNAAQRISIFTQTGGGAERLLQDLETLRTTAQDGHALPVQVVAQALARLDQILAELV